MKEIKKLLLFVLMLSVMSCGAKKQVKQLSGLRKLTNQELIERARISNFPDINTVQYLNEKGDIISRDSIEKLGYINFAFDDYVDASGIVKVTVIRPIDEAYKKLVKEMDAAFEEGLPVNDVPINCTNIGRILDSIKVEDQRHRVGEGTINLMVDHSNLEVIVSLIDKCGMPTSENISKEQIFTIWLVIQHSKLKYQKKYLPILKEAASKGDLCFRDIAMMEDRILLGEKKAQIYGTQICFDNESGKYILCQPVEEEANINARRKKIGFEPIEDYLKRFN